MWQKVKAYRRTGCTVTLERWNDSYAFRLIIDDVETGKYETIPVLSTRDGALRRLAATCKVL